MNQHNLIQDDNDLYLNRQSHQKQLMSVGLDHWFDFHLDLFDQFFAIKPIQFNYNTHYCHAKAGNSNIHR